jgi:hypothetical protein
MDDTEIRYEIGELDGCRLVEVIYPTSIDLSKLSTATAKYVALWEVDVPTVFLNDFVRTDVVDEARANVFLSLLRRNDTRPNFWGSTFVVGGNDALARQVYELLEAAERRSDCVYTTRDEAVDALRQMIALKTGEPRAPRD